MPEVSDAQRAEEVQPQQAPVLAKRRGSTVPRTVSPAFEISPSNGPAAIAASTVGWTVNLRSEPLGSG
jgi:hypothetical protein